MEKGKSIYNGICNTQWQKQLKNALSERHT